MELKSYFKKYGWGWIVLGITITLGSMYYLFNDYTKDPWGGINTAYRNLPAIIIVPTLMVFVPFLLGFFGWVRLFALLIVWDLVVIITGGGRESISFAVIVLPLLLIIAIVSGVILEIRHKKSSKI